MTKFTKRYYIRDTAQILGKKKLLKLDPGDE